MGIPETPATSIRAQLASAADFFFLFSMHCYHLTSKAHKSFPIITLNWGDYIDLLRTPLPQPEPDPAPSSAEMVLMVHLPVTWTTGFSLAADFQI